MAKTLNKLQQRMMMLYNSLQSDQNQIIHETIHRCHLSGCCHWWGAARPMSSGTGRLYQVFPGLPGRIFCYTRGCTKGNYLDCDKCSLTQHIAEPTRWNDTLDLLFTNNVDLYDLTLLYTLYLDQNIIEIQSSTDTKPSRRNSRHHKGEFSKF